MILKILELDRLASPPIPCAAQRQEAEDPVVDRACGAGGIPYRVSRRTDTTARLPKHRRLGLPFGPITEELRVVLARLALDRAGIPLEKYVTPIPSPQIGAGTLSQPALLNL